MLWVAPVSPFIVVRGFTAPAHTYAAGHRGLDLRAAPGQAVVAPAAGTIAFAGRVAGRAVVTVVTGDVRMSFEPVATSLPVGTAGSAGQRLGTVTADPGHCPGTCLHLGVRRDGTYLDPLPRFRRIRLLPLT